MIILIDNYDSFTWNLWHFLKELGAEVNVFRNDEISLQKINKMNPKGIVISPGPGIPENAGITIELIKNVKAKIPILGVCLGHQAIGVAFGAKLKRINPPIHGKISKIIHNKLGILNLIPNQRIKVTRYHSLIIDENRIPKELDITAKTDDGIIMGIKHKNYECHGVQFHPESVLSEFGYRIFYSFLQKCGYKNNKVFEFKFLEDKLTGNI